MGRIIPTTLCSLFLAIVPNDSTKAAFKSSAPVFVTDRQWKEWTHIEAIMYLFSTMATCQGPKMIEHDRYVFVFNQVICSAIYVFPFFLQLMQAFSIRQFDLQSFQYSGMVLSSACQQYMISNCDILNHIILPIGSMYAIYGNIYHHYTPNVNQHHGSYGLCYKYYTYIVGTRVMCRPRNRPIQPSSNVNVLLAYPVTVSGAP